MAIVQFARRGKAVKFTGANSAELISMLADHQIVDQCTVSMVDLGGGAWSVRHTQAGEPTYPLIHSMVAGQWLVVEMNLLVTSVGDTEFALYFQQYPEMAGQMAAAGAFRQSFGARAVVVPAAVNLAPATRSVAVTWPRALPAGTGSAYDVDICPDTALSVGSPYAFGVTGKTETGCTLTYTNASLIVTLGAGTVDLFPTK